MVEPTGRCAGRHQTADQSQKTRPRSDTRGAQRWRRTRYGRSRNRHGQRPTCRAGHRWRGRRLQADALPGRSPAQALQTEFQSLQTGLKEKSLHAHAASAAKSDRFRSRAVPNAAVFQRRQKEIRCGGFQLPCGRSIARDIAERGRRLNAFAIRPSRPHPP